MAQEKEIKIQLRIPLSIFLERIQTKGFKLLHTIKQTDIYFDTKDWFLYEHLAALRLRLTDGKDYSFSFKKLFYLPKKQGNYYIEEIEIQSPFDKIDELDKIFNRLGILYRRNNFKSGKELTQYLILNQYLDEQKMAKIRQVYCDGRNEIEIDTIDNVGVVVELECLEDEPLDIIEDLLIKDEWDRSVEGTGYIWLKNVKGLTSHLSNLERFKTKPDWNVWKNERDMYSKLQSHL